MFSILGFAVVGLTLAALIRYLIQRWLGGEPPEEWVDRSEVRLWSTLRWFTGMWPETPKFTRSRSEQADRESATVHQK